MFVVIIIVTIITSNCCSCPNRLRRFQLDRVSCFLRVFSSSPAAAPEEEEEDFVSRKSFSSSSSSSSFSSMSSSRPFLLAFGTSPCCRPNAFFLSFLFSPSSSSSSHKKTNFGSNSFGSIFCGAKKSSQTTKISALTLRLDGGFVDRTRRKNC